MLSDPVTLRVFAVLSRNIAVFCEDVFIRKPENQEPTKSLPGFLIKLFLVAAKAAPRLCVKEFKAWFRLAR
jgi:hypothetical protein